MTDVPVLDRPTRLHVLVRDHPPKPSIFVSVRELESAVMTLLNATTSPNSLLAKISTVQQLYCNRYPHSHG
jgi:hypothetical protein